MCIVSVCLLVLLHILWLFQLDDQSDSDGDTVTEDEEWVPTKHVNPMQWNEFPPSSNDEAEEMLCKQQGAQDLTIAWQLWARARGSGTSAGSKKRGFRRGGIHQLETRVTGKFWNRKRFANIIMMHYLHQNLFHYGHACATTKHAQKNILPHTCVQLDAAQLLTTLCSSVGNKDIELNACLR